MSEDLFESLCDDEEESKKPVIITTMTQTVMTIYPNGKRYYKVRTWETGKKQFTPKKPKKNEEYQPEETEEEIY